jgi:hypothetical protein
MNVAPALQMIVVLLTSFPGVGEASAAEHAIAPVRTARGNLRHRILQTRVNG